MGQNDKKDKPKNVILVGDSMLNSINSHGLSKSKKVSFSNHPGANLEDIFSVVDETLKKEDILSAVDETLKTNPDTLTVYAGANGLTKTTNTLRNVKKICKKVKRISPSTKIAFSNIIYRKNKQSIELSVLTQDTKILYSEKYILNK